MRRSDCATNFGPIDPDCSCRTCCDHSLSALHLLFAPKETVACSLLTIHNLHYQVLDNIATSHIYDQTSHTSSHLCGVSDRALLKNGLLSLSVILCTVSIRQEIMTSG